MNGHQSDNAVAANQRHQNASSKLRWESFGAHRLEIARLLSRAAAECVADRPTLCVLGAGNCNDLELPQLAERFAEAHLVDIDRAAIELAATQQGVRDWPGLRLHAPVDLTGIAHVVSRWVNWTPPQQEMDLATDLTARAPLPAIGPFDVVLSPCLLSQLIYSVSRVLKMRSLTHDALLASVRKRHLRMLAELLRPGGVGVMAIDLVAQETFPNLAKANPEDLAELMPRLLQSGQHFQGIEPRLIESGLRDAGVERIDFTHPWLWQFGKARRFLVYGVVFRKPLAEPAKAGIILAS
jgi:hypothetical protein